VQKTSTVSNATAALDDTTEEGVVVVVAAANPIDDDDIRLLGFVDGIVVAV